jgi:hypothetical protein
MTEMLWAAVKPAGALSLPRPCLMPPRYTGPAMDLANMRSLGMRAVDALALSKRKTARRYSRRAVSELWG